MTNTSVVCGNCKKLIPVVENKIADHSKSDGDACPNSGSKYVPQRWGSSSSGGRLKGHWERVPPHEAPDPSTLKLVGVAPVTQDIGAAIFVEKGPEPAAHKFAD